MAPILATDFPAPRLKRAGGPVVSTSPVQSTSAAPQTRLLSFQLSCIAGRRSTVMFGPFRAPAAIIDCQFSYTSSAVPIASGLELGIAFANQPENMVLTTTTRPYVPLVETQWQPLGVFNQNVFGFYNESVGGMGKVLNYSVRKLVTTPDWFLAVAFQNDGAGGNAGGHVCVVEGLSDEAARTFL